jgi:hypothetical protein
MHRKLKLYVCSIVLASAAIALAKPVAPLITTRSRSSDTAIELSGWANQIHLSDPEDFYGTFAITPQYNRTFRPEKTIAPALFGDELAHNCDCPTINISGKCAEGRVEGDWLADYFGLPQDFQSYVTFSPRVDSVSANFSLFLGLNELCHGMYIKIHAPVEHVRYRLGFEETVINKGSQPHEEGYFSNVEIPRDNLLANFAEFAGGCKAPVLDGIIPASNTNNGLGTNAPGNVEFLPLNCAKMNTCGKLTKTRLSDIQMALGWYCLQEHDSHLGIELLVAAPTGNKPCGDYLFEPIVGNGHHWELGGGINGHMLFWQSDDEQSHFGLWMQANISHMFNAKQRRFFDLINGSHSRYMLAAKTQAPVQNLFASPNPIPVLPDPTAPSAQFTRVLQPVANLTRGDVNVSIGVQSDVSAMFNYTRCGWSWDLGYNFWARSSEKITADCTSSCMLANEPRSWVLKGDAYVIGFSASDAEVPTPPVNTPIALSASDSNATIHSGSNVPADKNCNNGRGDPATTPANTAPDTRRNQYIDHAEFAFFAQNATSPIHFRRRATVGSNGANNQTNTSHNPIFLTIDDIDFCSAETKGRSHKIFTHLSYTWLDSDCWTPYIGLGGKLEFSKSHNICQDSGCDTVLPSINPVPCSIGLTCGSCSDWCQPPCPESVFCNFTEWGVWIKGGIAFD